MKTQKLEITGPAIKNPDVDRRTGKPDTNLDPKANAIRLVRTKQGDLVGRDFLGMVFDFVNGFISRHDQNISINIPSSDNPSTLPYGKAYWRLVNTESDYQNAVSMVQHVWGGWSLKKDKVLEIIRTVNQQFDTGENKSLSIIPENDFRNIESLDFFRITAQLSILPQGVQKIQDLLIQSKYLAGGYNINGNNLADESEKSKTDSKAFSLIC
jgi:hypothetical protein